MSYINHTLEYPFSFTQEQVNTFIDITGDNNPIHWDENYASNTIFKKPIIHGALSVSVFSKVFATQFPGEGTIYLKQSASFLKPMYVNTKYKAVFKVLDHNTEKHKVTIETRITDIETGETTVLGEAVLLNTIIL